MDTYTISFTLPRSSGSHAFVPESPPAAHSVETAIDDSGKEGTSTSSPSTQQQQQQQSQPQHAHHQHPFSGRLGSMRSRFPPSVKAFMPSAFGGSKRTNDRIAEVTGAGEKEEDLGDLQGDQRIPGTVVERLARSSSEWRKARLKSTSSLPLSVPEEGPSNRDEDLVSDVRDSRSTAGTRSSFDFTSSAASVSADSTAPSTTAGTGYRDAAGKQRHQLSHSDPSSANHSASGSITSLGAQHPLTAVELAEATQKLSLDVMAATQCLVSCTAVQDEATNNATPISAAGSKWPNAPASYSPFGGSGTGHSQQLPFPTGGNYPYQHYAQGFGQDLGGAFTGGYPGTPRTFVSGLGSTASLASSLSQTQPQPPLGGLSASNTGVVHDSRPPKMPRYNFNLSGTLQQVMNARGTILREHPFRSRVSVKVPKADVIDDASSSSTGTACLKSHVRLRLEEIASSTNTHIAVVGKDARGADLGYGLETERNVELVVSGELQGVEFGRIRVLVFLDELNGLTSTTCEIDQKFHNIIGGRKRSVIQTIQEQTSTSIYMPLPLSSNFGSKDAVASLQNTVHITGDFFGVQRARDMLFQVYVHKSKNTFSRDTAILPRKIDWMLSDHLEDLRQVMIDNGTFISMPPLGSQSSKVSVCGDNKVNIERSIRTMMSLACQFYIASLWLLPPAAYNALVAPDSTLNSAQLTPVLKKVANETGAEVVLKGNNFEIHGLETEVKNAVETILDLDVVKQFTFEVRFQIELATSEREFLQGRKCGKINKIMKQCGVRIKFETFNDYNFLIDLSSNDRAGALQGLALLQEELPAEVSFHVPEAYHKRCIGVGGKQIQKVMKKYGVYVKFSNAEEFAALGGYLDNEDNVIARTPAKNAINLENLKQSVMEMVNPKDKDYTTETVTISRRYHRNLLGEKGIFIHDIENKCSSKVIFPPRETASDLVYIFGPESQIHIASAMLLEHVPFEAEFRTPSSSNLSSVVGSQDFVALTERVKRDLNISISPAIIPQGNAEAVFKLRLSRSNSDFLPTAKDLLEDFLVSRNINVYAAPARARSDSFATSFPHFATKLISTPSTEAADASAQYHADLAARFNEGGRLRAAASSPALKALFDSPAGAAGGFPPRPAHHSHNYTTTGAFPGLSTTSGVSRAPGTASPIVGSSLYSSPYADTMPGGVSSDVWGAPPSRPMTLSNAGPVGGGSPGVSFPNHNARQSDDAGLLYRSGQDAFGVDDRIRQLRKPRSFAHRAQSLDISQLGAQQAALDATAYVNQRYPQAPGMGSGAGNPGPGYGAAGGAYGYAMPSSGFGGLLSQGVGGSPAPYPHHMASGPGNGPGALPPMSMNAGPNAPHGHPYPHQQHAPSPSLSRLPSTSSAVGSHVPQHPAPHAATVDEVSRMFNGISFPQQ